MKKELKEDWKLEIVVEESVTWLKDDGVAIIGYDNIDLLLEKLQGVIHLDDDFIIIIDDEKELINRSLFT